MQIILADGTVLTAIMVIGAHKYVQGSNRDVLSFVFNDTMSLDELDVKFSAEACESITIIGDDNTEAIYTGYTIRTELVKKAVVVQESTPETEEVTENRVTISMAQRTYAESQILIQAQRIEALEKALYNTTA